MKKVLHLAIVVILLFASNVLNAQTNVGIGTTSPDASAKLDVESTSQGFLPPRLSRSQMVAISSPASGLLIWNTDDLKLNVFNGTAWVDIAGNVVTVLPQIGDLYGGGILIHFFVSGENGYVVGETHGLICATSDEGGSSTLWGCYGSQFADNAAMGYGGQNTALIVANSCCAQPGNAAYICDQRTVGGNDWFLPSIVELQTMFLLKTTIETKTGILLSGHYWSSGENSTVATRVFADGTYLNRRKDYGNYTRAMRYF